MVASKTDTHIWLLSGNCVFSTSTMITTLPVLANLIPLNPQNSPSGKSTNPPHPTKHSAIHFRLTNPFLGPPFLGSKKKNVQTVWKRRRARAIAQSRNRAIARASKSRCGPRLLLAEALGGLEVPLRQVNARGEVQALDLIHASDRIEPSDERQREFERFGEVAGAE